MGYESYINVWLLYIITVDSRAFPSSFIRLLLHAVIIMSVLIFFLVHKWAAWQRNKMDYKSLWNLNKICNKFSQFMIKMNKNYQFLKRKNRDGQLTPFAPCKSPLFSWNKKKKQKPQPHSCNFFKK
jgi:hypothetical protein